MLCGGAGLIPCSRVSLDLVRQPGHGAAAGMPGDGATKRLLFHSENLAALLIAAIIGSSEAYRLSA